MEKLAERKKPLTPETLNMEFYSTFFSPLAFHFAKRLQRKEPCNMKSLHDLKNSCPDDKDPPKLKQICTCMNNT
jgi:hypothetical protein